MPLKLIHGPLNSGRAGQIRRRLLENMARSPLLAVPTGDDVFAFERELCGEQGASLGAAVVDFNGLIRQVATIVGVIAPPKVTEIQGRALIEKAAERSRLRILADSARRAGFTTSVQRLIEELRTTLLGSDSLAAEAASQPGDAAYLGEIVSIHRSYAEILAEHGLSDSHEFASTAIAALRSNPDSWENRPVFLYGFDDLSPEQFELVSALVGACDVTVSLTYEDREALGARAALLARLRDLGPANEETTEPQSAHTRSSLLFHLERNFAEPDPPRTAPDQSLTFLSAAGERSEAELVGSEIAALIASGTDPGQIAVVLRSPASRGPLYRTILESYGVPVALEARVPIRSTATGDAILALLRAAFTSRSAEDLMAYLRAPRRMAADGADWLERKMIRGRVRTADDLSAVHDELADHELRDLVRLRDAASSPERLLSEIAAIARDIAEWPLALPGSQGVVPGPSDSEELRAGALIASAAEELAALEKLGKIDPEFLIRTIASLELPLWRGPALGRVRIASPYQFRAARFGHVFIASLQDGEFPRRNSEDPFLSEEQRLRLGLVDRAESDAEELYLFYSCLSLATEKLWLSSRSVDEDGGSEEPSPMFDEIRRLLDPPPPEDDDGHDPVVEAITRRRALGDLTFPIAVAPSEGELCRSLAMLQTIGDNRPDLGPEQLVASLSLSAEAAASVADRLAGARAAGIAANAPENLKLPAVRSGYAQLETFGGTTLEEFAVCSYRWFINHELKPQGLDPTPEILSAGSLAHAVLQGVYEARPGDDPLPREDSLGVWQERAAELINQLAGEFGLDSPSPSDRAARARVLHLIRDFLSREAGRDSPVLEPAIFEASFGDRPDDQRPPLTIDGWKLRGKIDRIDKSASAGLVQDYKLSASATPGGKFEKEGKLQLPLYAIAARELWGIDVIGGIYQPLAATGDKRPRGLLKESARDDAFADLDLVKTDVLADHVFDQLLIDSRERATRFVRAIQAGEISRNPLGGKCPSHCTFAPICRRERGADEQKGESES